MRFPFQERQLLLFLLCTLQSYFGLHQAEWTPYCWLKVHFLLGGRYDKKVGILNIHCWFIHKKRNNGSIVDMWKGFQKATSCTCIFLLQDAGDFMAEYHFQPNVFKLPWDFWRQTNLSLDFMWSQVSIQCVTALMVVWEFKGRKSVSEVQSTLKLENVSKKRVVPFERLWKRNVAIFFPIRCFIVYSEDTSKNKKKVFLLSVYVFICTLFSSQRFWRVSFRSTVRCDKKIWEPVDRGHE